MTCRAFGRSLTLLSEPGDQGQHIQPPSSCRWFTALLTYSTTMAPRKKKTPVSGLPKTTRSSAPAHIDVSKPPSSATESSTIPPLQKLHIPLCSAITSHSMTPTVSSTPTTTQAPSPTGSLGGLISAPQIPAGFW